jgi:hypothetical protein
LIFYWLKQNLKHKKTKNMKTNWKFFMFLMIAVYTLLSCEEDSLDPLSGSYTPPEEYDFTLLESQTRVKEGALYVFSITLKDGESNALNMKLVANEYILPASDFTPSESKVKKTFLTGSNGSTFGEKQIVNGTISLAVQDSNYTMSGILYMVDETVLKINASFTIAYEPDPYIPSFTYEVETETPAMGGAHGSTPIEASTKHKITVYTDDVLLAYLEVVADEKASSLSGTYSIKDGINAVGQINNGYYLDLSWWGSTGIVEGGSYYVDADEKMFIREGEGAITIVDDNGTLTITGSNLAILDVDALIASSGATWGTLETPGSLNIVEAKLKGSGTNSLSYINFITTPATYGDWTPTEINGSQLNVIKIVNSTNDTVAVFELISAEGAADLSGDYNVLDGSAETMAIGDANNGYYVDMSWYNQGNDILIGGCYYVENDENKYIRSGSLIHVVDNGGALTFSGVDLGILDVETLVSSNGATWQNLETTGSCSFTNIVKAESK